MATHEYYLAWWNVENLFDAEDSPARSERLQSRLKSELDGWTARVRNRKIVQLARIIRQMNGGNGPDILGVCEVENDVVLALMLKVLNGVLPERSYAFAMEESEDWRGIDVAFIYDTKRFQAGAQFAHRIVRRNPTRDLFQVNFISHASGRPLVLIANHWPSRLGGQYESEPYRILAGETLAYWHERIREELDVRDDNGKVTEETAIIAMGDFNDEPFNRAMTDYALSSNNPVRVMRARNPMFFNLMWQVMGEGAFSYYYGSEPNMLDQIMVNEALLKRDSAWKVLTYEDANGLMRWGVAVEAFDEMVSGGLYPAPIRFNRPSSSDYNPDGYSDHFPISVVIMEEA